MRDAVKTSAGALYKIPVCRSQNLKDTIDYVKACGLQVIAASEKATEYHFQVDFTTTHRYIIMGSEEDGVSMEYIKRCDKNNPYSNGWRNRIIERFGSCRNRNV